MKHSESLYVSAVALFLLWAMIFSPANAGAQPFAPQPRTPNASERHHGHRRAYPKPGVRIKVLPRAYRTLHLGPLTYFFMEGVFYRPDIDGYVVVPAPVGARVTVLPAEAIPVTADGITYYTYAGVYYQKVSEGYMVVAKPGTQTPPDAAIAWEGDQIRVTAAVLNVRSGPGKNHTVLRQVKRGDLLVVQASSSDWYYVQLGDKSFGWVMIKYTTQVKSQPVG